MGGRRRITAGQRPHRQERRRRNHRDQSHVAASPVTGNSISTVLANLQGHLDEPAQITCSWSTTYRRTGSSDGCVELLSLASGHGAPNCPFSSTPPHG
jgi:hypothetical protein